MALLTCLLPDLQAPEQTLPPAPSASVTPTDIQRTGHFLDGRACENTRASYRSAWKAFAQWAGAGAALAMPASPALVAAYLSHLAKERHLLVVYVRFHRAALAAIHKANGHADPIDNEGVRRALKVPPPPDTQPSQAAIRRATSTAYYTAFHALTASNAVVLAGTGAGQLPSEAWIRACRGLNHGYARAQLLQNRSLLSTNGHIFADIFCQLQEERVPAAYNPRVSFTPESARVWPDKAEDAVTDLLQTAQGERAAMAILRLVRPR